MESSKYPFQGMQFHPAKQIYEFGDDTGYNHSWNSILLNRYFADTWIKEARENSNKIGDYAETQQWIFENDAFFVTDTYYGDVYMFP